MMTFGEWLDDILMHATADLQAMLRGIDELERKRERQAGYVAALQRVKDELECKEGRDM